MNNHKKRWIYDYCSVLQKLQKSSTGMNFETKRFVGYILRNIFKCNFLNLFVIQYLFIKKNNIAKMLTRDVSNISVF